jgi:hypothetical protein
LSDLAFDDDKKICSATAHHDPESSTTGRCAQTFPDAEAQPSLREQKTGPIG